MPFQLVILKGRSANQALRLPAEGVTTVGRQQGCQIRISSSQVSRKHCELYEKQGHLVVKDLNSSNGTLVNGVKIEGQKIVEPGQTLTIGSVVFRIEQAGAPGATPAAGRPGDTGVPAAVAVGGDQDIELDFEVTDEPSTESTPAPPPLKPAARPAPAPAPAAAAAKAAAAAPKPAPAQPAPTPPADPDSLLRSEGEPGLGEDAVAEYLMGLDVDDDDK